MRISNLIEKLKNISIILFLCFMFYGSVSAEPGGSVYVAGVTKYLWRGQVLYHKGALQPGLDLNYKKLSIGLWGSYNLADSFASVKKYEFGEADVTISLSDSYKKLGYSFGYVYYTFPIPSSPSLSSEYFLGLSMDVFLSPGITLYYDVAKEGGDGAYAELALSLPFTLGIDFSLDASVGYNAGQWGYRASPTILGLNLGTSYPIGAIDITSSIFGQIAMDKQYKNGNKIYDGYVSLGTAYNF